jgi:hypothetical protein
VERQRARPEINASTSAPLIQLATIDPVVIMLLQAAERHEEAERRTQFDDLVGRLRVQSELLASSRP